MTGTYAAADDLAALDRVTELAQQYGVEFAGTELRLRGCLEREHQRYVDVGVAWNSAWDAHLDRNGLVGEGATPTPLLAGILAVQAVASAGAEIVWPSPEVGEGGSGPAAGGTAPGAVPPPTDTASALHRQCEKNPACAAPAGHKTPCWVLTNVTITEAGDGETPAGERTADEPVASASGDDDAILSPGRYREMPREYATNHFGFPRRTTHGQEWSDTPDGSRWIYDDARAMWCRSVAGVPETAREKILAEAAEVSYNTAGKDAEGLVALAVSVLSPGSRGPVTRYAVVNAIALLADAVERMRGAR